jgi:serine/threonine-protein kinase SRPK3
MNNLLKKAQGKKQQWLGKQNEDDYTDSEEDLTSDDEFDVSQDVIYTLYNNRYIPIKYIGRGTFSRVWLTYDIIENKLVGMKSIFEEYKEEARDEIKRCERIKNYIKEHDTSDIRLSTLHDNFIYKNGDICLVFELLGVSMMTIIEKFDGIIYLNAIKKVMKDMLSGLNTLHDLKLIHTDLKPENILTNIYTRGIIFYKQIFAENNFNEQYQEFVAEFLPKDYSNFNQAKKKKSKRVTKNKAGKKLCEKIKLIVNEAIEKGMNKFDESNNQITELGDVENEINLDNSDSEEEPQYFTFKDYQSQIILTNDEIVETIRAKIIDFGNCEDFDKKMQDEISVRSYRPPENFMNSFYNEKADIWTVGCLLFEFLTGEYLFEIDSDCGQNERDRRYLYEMFKILGKIPKNLCLECEFSKDLFDSKGRILKKREIDFTSISELLVDEADYQQESADELETVIKLFLEYDVNKRISAKDAMQLEWLN